MAKILCYRFEVSRVVLGWIGTILSIITLVLLCFCLKYPDVMTRWLISLADDESKIDYNEMRNDVIWASVLYIVLCVMNMITSICLILGIHRFCTPSLKYPFIHLTKKQEKVVKNKSTAALLTATGQPTQTFNV
ncbi:uncharacterized protein LOC105215988 [Zeugodacus cucurbitae]|uniref:uncharacterized protein LOC105215988 n=1 Tax=Zeugodacus cucurbitae TaxID=28588 RepID=UPI00059691E0|nr:uncharacterized protein LOC105215988 [Zeugodacus cucurbitae]